jgi:hypothetical protein
MFHNCHALEVFHVLSLSFTLLLTCLKFKQLQDYEEVFYKYIVDYFDFMLVILVLLFII